MLPVANKSFFLIWYVSFLKGEEALCNHKQNFHNLQIRNIKTFLFDLPFNQILFLVYDFADDCAYVALVDTTPHLITVLVLRW